ncbi:MAG TPA: cob(I)yrinic acid a,c-diamide adenosyltransferase [bacterium]|nr:cob(I)yrinic acid a,c-diamide adenosyltransferase [bacterium]
MTDVTRKTGEPGRTDLPGLRDVSKGHVRVEACGTVDELNAWIGVVVASLPLDQEPLRRELRAVQSVLLRAGSILATAPDSPVSGVLRPVTAEDVRFLETRIGGMKDELPPLSGFILPGGDPSCAWMHVARTVCRRAERTVVRLAEADESRSPHPDLQSVLIFLNRLSDYLFVLARWFNGLKGFPE